MTVDTFPIYELLVESIFGSVGLALLGVALAMFLILALTRTTTVFISYWMLFYLSVVMVMYLGGIGWILMYVLAGSYLIWNIVKTFNIGT